jgi:hypothetical protein
MGQIVIRALLELAGWLLVSGAALAWLVLIAAMMDVL